MGTPVIVMLDLLAEYQSQHDILRLDKEALIADVIPDEVKAKIAEIEAEFADKIEIVNENISGIEATIKHEVADYGKTIKGTRLMAVWSKGRTSWDTKALEGYGAAHPEILTFCKVGEPSVSIRKI